MDESVWMCASAFFSFVTIAFVEGVAAAIRELKSFSILILKHFKSFVVACKKSAGEKKEKNTGFIRKKIEKSHLQIEKEKDTE